MNRLRRWGQWAATAVAVLLLFWIAASVGGWSPDIQRLTTSVHGPLVADYRADSPQRLAPLAPEVTGDASRDQAGSGGSGIRPSGSPSPSGSGGPSPSASGSTPPPTPSLPVPSLPTTLPSLPTTLPSLPTATPTLPTLLPTPSLPTPPPLP